MRLDVTLLSTHKYVLEEVIDSNLIVKYIEDSQRYMCLTGYVFHDEDAINHLFHFLFNKTTNFLEIYRNGDTYVLDLSSLRSELINYDNIEIIYPKWLSETGRENTMDEFGMLVDFHGCIFHHLHKKFLLMIVSKS
jgi:hypothetical protein